MSSETIDFDSLFDADEYWQSGHCPWTFFAYPTEFAVDHGLPPDEEACRFLAAVQGRGIDVAIWVNGIAEDTTYFACKKHDIPLLKVVVDELQRASFGENFLSEHSEALFAKLDCKV